MSSGALNSTPTKLGWVGSHKMDPWTTLRCKISVDGLTVSVLACSDSTRRLEGRVSRPVARATDDQPTSVERTANINSFDAD